MDPALGEITGQECTVLYSELKALNSTLLTETTGVPPCTGACWASFPTVERDDGVETQGSKECECVRVCVNI